MKMTVTPRYRRSVLAGLSALALSATALDQFYAATLQTPPATPPLAGVTNSPASAKPGAPSASSKTNSSATNAPGTNAPAAMPPVELDKDTGKPVVTTPSGLKYVDLVVGTGPAAKTGDHLSVNYDGKLSTGEKFDSSYDRGVPFDLTLGVTSVIKGWTEGLAGMQKGGQRKLIIPPMLGYGLEGHGAEIPPNSTLIFKVEILDIK